MVDHIALGNLQVLLNLIHIHIIKNIWSCSCTWGESWKKSTEVAVFFFCSDENCDVISAEKILDEDHYGLSSVKERVLEHIATKRLGGTSQGQSHIAFIYNIL